MARKKKKDKASIGLLFWTAFVLFTVVVFLSNRSSIYDVLERTELIAVLERSVKRAVDNTIGRGAQPVADRYDYQAPKHDEDTKPIAPEVSAPSQEQPSGSPPPRGLAPIGERELADGRQEAPVPHRAPAAAPGAEQPVATIDQRDDAGPRLSFAEQNRRRIFFVNVTEAGNVAVRGVQRTIADAGAPLTATLASLFAGPDTMEMSEGLITLIPREVTLNRVYVTERVAYVDVSESFRFNPLGRDGLNAQLQQVVFSATEFPNVQLVQILIEGRRVDFLGPEGIFIGEPIGRENFQ